MVKIIFSVDEDCSWSNTQCPHADFLLRVGSVTCGKCKYLDCFAPVKRCEDGTHEYALFCNCPDDVKFSTFQNKEE